jgi:4-diphosphocytidyl-2C-methyl-D-erythritol kinase
MTGSGAAAFAVLDGEREARAAAAQLPPSLGARVVRTLSRHPLAAFA